MEFARAFAGSKLGRRFLAVLMTTLTVTSVLFLVFFVWSYRQRLVAEHTRASQEINSMLEASLKNAMLKRDIEGLRAILRDIGTRPDIAAVAILNPNGEIRFATEQELVGKAARDLGFDISGGAGSGFATRHDGVEVLRSINPVHNEARCQVCHGQVETHPVNGILVVDYMAADIRRDVLIGTLAMAGAGGLVFLLSMLAIGSTLYRYVLKPVRQLAESSAAFAHGNLESRVSVEGDHELADLGRHHNLMADRMKTMLLSVQASETFLQTLIDAVPDGIRVIAEDYTILKVNNAYRIQLQLTADPVGTRCHASSHHLAQPCSATMVTCPLIELAAAGAAPLKCRHRHLRTDGTELFVEVSAARAELVIDGTLRPCIIESIRDLAEQAKLSQDQRLSELGQLATGVAHEIYNPLSSIQLALRAIRDDLGVDGSSVDFGNYVDIANREIDRCVAVTERLMRLSAPPENQVALIELRRVVADVVSLLHYQAQQAGVAIETAILGNPRIIASEGDVGMIMVNLAQNAIHAMPNGGKLEIAVKPVDDKLALTIADSGVGISKDDLERVFWPFWSKRADGSMGAGLGLSLCKAAVERIGGSMQVQSTIGAGTQFTITIPDADRPNESIS